MSETEKKKQAFMAAMRAMDNAYYKIFLVQDKSFDSEQEALLQVSHQLVCRYCGQGRLKAALVGREWRISKDALREYIDGGKEL